MHAASAEWKLLSMKKAAKYKGREPDGLSKIQGHPYRRKTIAVDELLPWQQADLVSYYKTFYSSPCWVFAATCICVFSRECNSAVKRTERKGLTWHRAKRTSQLMSLYCSTQAQPSPSIGTVPAAVCRMVNALLCKLVPGLAIVLLERSLSTSKLWKGYSKADTKGELLA